MENKKEQVIRKAVESLQKRFGKESVNYLGNNSIESIPRISSQCIAIDDVTGGGYPRGRIIEVFGGESSGKTTACYHAIAEAQKKDRDTEHFCALIDSEFSFDPEYAAKCGVNVAELVVAQPDSGTDGFAILQGLIESGCSLAVVDSVAAMIPREEVEEEDYGKSMIGVQARMMSKALRKLTSIIGRYKAIVIFTNQTREKVGVMYGNPETTSGGNALKFYASIRLKFSKIGTIESGTGDNKEKTSVKTRVEAVKNKVAPPFKRGEFIITFGKGIDNEAAYFNAIIEKGLVQTKGAGWFSIDGKNIAQGTAKLKLYFEEHPEVYEKLKKMIDNGFGNEGSSEETKQPSQNSKQDLDFEDSDISEEVGEISSKES